ncbi:unnamed protein product [Effrenium voratum]|nr:unnamed protein product [Effrenium voratum]
MEITEPVQLVPTNEPEVDRKEACSTARANERARSQEEGGLLLHFFDSQDHVAFPEAVEIKDPVQPMPVDNANPHDEGGSEANTNDADMPEGERTQAIEGHADESDGEDSEASMNQADEPEDEKAIESHADESKGREDEAKGKQRGPGARLMSPRPSEKVSTLCTRLSFVFDLGLPLVLVRPWRFTTQSRQAPAGAAISDDEESVDEKQASGIRRCRCANRWSRCLRMGGLFA